MAPLAQMMMVRAALGSTRRASSVTPQYRFCWDHLLGPVLAGAILQHASWRWLFPGEHSGR